MNTYLKMLRMCSLCVICRVWLPDFPLTAWKVHMSKRRAFKKDAKNVTHLCES